MMCIGLACAKGPSVCAAAGRVRLAVVTRESGPWGEVLSEVEERLEVVMDERLEVVVEALVLVLGLRSVLLELERERAWLRLLRVGT